jgi:hypothetical protein
MAELAGFVGSKGSAKQKRMLMIVKRIANDVCEELQDQDQETLSDYFAQMGQVISWIGTGTYDGMSDQMREWIRPRAEGIENANGYERVLVQNLDIDSPNFGGIHEEMVATKSGIDTGDAGASPESG